MSAMEAAAGPTDAEVWRALISYEATLDSYTVPGSLRNAMLTHLLKTYRAEDINQDLSNFALLFKDRHYRELCRRCCSGPASELFSGSIFRRMKSSRLEGHWDMILESFFDWVDDVLGEEKTRVSYSDCEQIVACLKPKDGSKGFQKRIDLLFCKDESLIDQPSLGFRRNPGFLPHLSCQGYANAYSKLLQKVPEEQWDLRQLLWEVQNRGGTCKIIMLHVCTWYNPELKEPGHRTDNKYPLYHHLKPVFSDHVTATPSYVNDNDWEVKALLLQRLVVLFVLQNWISIKSSESNLREPQLGDPSYIMRFRHEVWQRLVCELRASFDIPFKHNDLALFNRSEVLLPSVVKSITDSILYNRHISGQSAAYTAESSSSQSVALFSGVKEVVQDEFNVPTEMAQSRRTSAVLIESDSESNIVELQVAHEDRPATSRKRNSMAVKEEFVYEQSNGQITEVEQPQTKSPSIRASRSASQTTTSLGTVASFTYSSQQRAYVPPLNATIPGPYVQHQSSYDARLGRPRKQFRQDNHRLYAVHRQQHQSRRSVPNIPPISPSLILRSSDSSQPAFTHNTPNDNVEQLNSYHSPNVDASTKRPRHHNLPQDLSRVISPFNLESSTQITRRSSVDASETTMGSRFRILPPPPTSKSSTPKKPEAPPAPPRYPTILDKSKVEQVVEQIQDHYGSSLGIDDMLTAIDGMKNEKDAEIFLTLRAGPLRDSWLDRLIRSSASACEKSSSSRGSLSEIAYQRETLANQRRIITTLEQTLASYREVHHLRDLDSAVTGQYLINRELEDSDL